MATDYSDVEPWIEDAARTILRYFREEGELEPEDIEQVISRRIPKPEDQPIRRGDVVQVTDGEFIGLTGVVVDQSRSLIVVEFRSFTHMWKSRITGIRVEPENLVRIGRAKFMPDGTPVED